MSLSPKIFDRAVNFLGATLMMCVGLIGAIVIFTDDPIPDVLQNIAIGSLTGLVGLISQRGDDTPVPVEVVKP